MKFGGRRWHKVSKENKRYDFIMTKRNHKAKTSLFSNYNTENVLHNNILIFK